MASSSAQRKYQVFLSFRGQDTRLNFTSHLHEALKGKGIDTFMDDQLIRGDEISPALLTAIQESTISIIVLSKNYASSRWCLEELSKILECKERKGQIVVPIFYHVDPSHVRNQKGSFEEAFEKHQERFKDRTDKVERWRDALKEVGNLSGYHIHGQPNDRPESRLIVEIVEDISNKLMYKSLYDTKCLIGIDSYIKQIESLLCFASVDVRIVGIWGMGGIGKTTMAEVVYNRFFAKFEGCCFLTNAKENYGRVRLREDLFFKILEDRNLNVSTSLLPAYIKERVQHKKVLIVLDDVDDSMQLHLLVKKHYFGPGSRVILTSRDKQVLQPVVDEIYEVENLNHNEAHELFSLCAFKQIHPRADFLELSKRVVHYAKGVPLALRVLGSALYGKSKLFWEDELNKLKEIPNPKIDSILRISFDGLDCEVKDIFLDIACFFKWMDRDYVTYILGGCYRSVMCGISVLSDKSLITIQHKGLVIHDLVQQMAWNIVRQESKEPGKRSRLWTPKDIQHVLKNNTGTESVEGIFLDISKISREVFISPTAFTKMHNLKFLKFYYSTFKERKGFLCQRLESLPDTLTYLHWDDCPLKSLPSNFCPENLVELCILNSHVKQLWNGVQNLVKLKTINLNNSRQLIKIPDLSRATNLEIMSLGGCTSLVEAPSSIGYLNNLRYLGLGCCENTYGEFPDSFHWRLHFSIDYCSNITKFPKIPRNVESLCLSGTAIEEVPSSIGCLSRLTYLCLRDCRRLKKLPSSICKLKLLEELHLNGCLELESFPEILEIMERLEVIDLSGTWIEELPSSIEHLVGLKSLWLNNCENLKNLPSSIRKLNSLKYLSLKKCSNITKFLEIRGNLMNLDLSETVIEQLPSSIECYSKIWELNLPDCAKLGSLPRCFFESKSPCISQVSCFQVLSLEGIQEHLGTVEVVNIHPLDRTAESGNMRFELRWSNNVSLFSHLSLNDLGSLRNNIGNMRSLRELIVSNSSEFEEFPDNLENLKSLTYLVLRFCNLSVFSSRLTSISLLTKLNLCGNNFEIVPASINQLLKLEWLDLSYCERLQSLPVSIKQLLKLEELNLSNCKRLQSLPDQLPPNLHILDAHDCTSLEVVSIAFPTGYDQRFIFTNCINLDQKAIFSKTQLYSQQIATEDAILYHEGINPGSFHICFPGSDIPEWFNCQNLGSRVSTLLPLYLHDHNDRKFVSFALCIVVTFDDLTDSNVQCRCDFKINGHDYHNFSCCISPWDECPIIIGSDHVFLVYDSDLYLDWEDGESNYHLNEASFEFSVCNLFGGPLDSCMVKKCGVHLLYGQVSLSHPPSESESDARACNPLMIQPSSPYNPVVEDVTNTKRSHDDYCCDEAVSSGNFRSHEGEEPRLKRLKQYMESF